MAANDNKESMQSLSMTFKPSDLAIYLEGIANYTFKAISEGNRPPLPVFIWGPPGVGKSDIVRQVGEKLKAKVIDIRVPLLDPTDIRGLPVADMVNHTAEWLPPAFLPNADRDGDKIILFLDELSAAPPTVQASCYQLVLDRKVGEYTLPKNVVIIAAGNRKSDRAISHTMSSALMSRFTHCELTTDFKDWSYWAIKNKTAPEIIAFLKDAETLFDYDPAKDDPRAFPSPRTWAAASALYKAGFEDQILKKALSGAVGQAAANKFMGWLKIKDRMPNIDAILAGEPIKVDKQDIAYVTVYTLSVRATEKTLDNVWKWSLQFDEYPEIAVLLAKTLEQGRKDLDPLNTKKYPKFSEWLNKFLKHFTY